MADRITPEQRSRNMQQVHSKDTKPEIYIRRLLFLEGYRYRIHSKHIPGHPDIWMKKYNTALFVHGCFWHRHKGCKYASIPSSNSDFWDKKFQDNIERDEVVREQLASLGIKCLVIWECTIKEMRKNMTIERKIINQIIEFLNSEHRYIEI